MDKAPNERTAAVIEANERMNAVINASCDRIAAAINAYYGQLEKQLDRQQRIENAFYLSLLLALIIPLVALFVATR